MKTNTIWVLISGLAIGVLIGKELPRSGDSGGGGKTGSSETAPSAAAPAGTPTEMPATWIKPEEISAADAVKDLTPAQKYLVMKVMNEKPCDCGCPHGSVAKCKKDDPGCPRAPLLRGEGGGARLVPVDVHVLSAQLDGLLQVGAGQAGQ
jgi:hypothetical protein